MSARQRSSAASSASNSSAAPLRASAARQRSAIRPCGLEVDHGESLGALGTGDRRDVRRDVGDLLLAERARERGHPALAVRHAVERRARRSGCESSRFGPTAPVDARVRERVAAAARRGAEEDLLAGDRVALGGRRRLRRLRLRLRRLGLGRLRSRSSRSPSSPSSSRPSTVSGVAVCSSSPPHPAATTPNAATRRTRRRAVRRITPILYTPHGPNP